MATATHADDAGFPARRYSRHSLHTQPCLYATVRQRTADTSLGMGNPAPRMCQLTHTPTLHTVSLSVANDTATYHQPPEGTMKAVAYLRVSTDEQAESRAGLEAQLHAITQHCHRQGIELVATFTDEGISGAAQLDKRPGLLDAVNAITKGMVVIVAKRDRLARDVVACALVERMVAKRGGRVLSVAGEGTDNDDATSILMRRIVDAFAEHERLVIAARTRAALQAKRRRGERAGRVPYGYELADADTATSRSRSGRPVQLVPVHEQLSVVERIRREHAAGLSMRTIAQRLTDDGIPTANGAARWCHSSVQRVVARFKGVAEATADVLVNVAGSDRRAAVACGGN